MLTGQEEEMNYYRTTVTLTKDIIIEARNEAEAEDRAFEMAWDVLPDGYEVSDVKVKEDME